MKMHRSDSRAFHVYILCCRNLFMLPTVFTCFSMCGVRGGHHGPLEHDILKRTVDCATLACCVYNLFTGNQQ